MDQEATRKGIRAHLSEFLLAFILVAAEHPGIAEAGAVSDMAHGLAGLAALPGGVELEVCAPLYGRAPELPVLHASAALSPRLLSVLIPSGAGSFHRIDQRRRINRSRGPAVQQGYAGVHEGAGDEGHEEEDGGQWPSLPPDPGPIARSPSHLNSAAETKIETTEIHRSHPPPPLSAQRQREV